MFSSLWHRRLEVVLINAHEARAKQRLSIVNPEVAVIAVCNRGVEAAYGDFQVGENVFGHGVPAGMQRLPQGVVGSIFGLGAQDSALDLERRMDPFCQRLLRILPARHHTGHDEERPNENDAPFVDGGQSRAKFIPWNIGETLEFKPPPFQNHLGVAFLCVATPGTIVG